MTIQITITVTEDDSGGVRTQLDCPPQEGTQAEALHANLLMEAFDAAIPAVAEMAGASRPVKLHDTGPIVPRERLN